jgi:hypothetical protein
MINTMAVRSVQSNQTRLAPRFWGCLKRRCNITRFDRARHSPSDIDRSDERVPPTNFGSWQVSSPSTGVVVNGARSILISILANLSKARRTAVFLVALFSFVWLNFVAETHSHQSLTGASPASVGVHGGLRAELGQPLPDQPADCPICNEIAHSSVYLLPTLIAFAVTALASTWIAQGTPTIAVVHTRSHGWHSRAPPLLSHA